MAEGLSVPGAAALLAVAVWLAASFAFQLERFRTVLGQADRFRLLPSWSFFAPNPAYRDAHLTARYVLGDGQVERWQSVDAFPVRSLLDLVWNPAKRRRKVLRDAGKAVRQMAPRAQSKAALQCSLPYLVLLHYALQASVRPSGAIAIQFAMIESSGRENRRLWISFISDLHPL